MNDNNYGPSIITLALGIVVLSLGGLAGTCENRFQNEDLDALEARVAQLEAK